ncbi:hypothetical protein JCM9140_2315 [Halalkalibacter wakoensis JCM 9140]|uniref:Uncharacterized protein n=1 Tax=Halalkalibacter wakoensis JCM 9140 TaxID=1236970 RepID=W4Q2F6_9BACI|nr:hypothetical protein JCM9140_2315 [Halalkalibacter wakoensis JCM 9140]
MIVIGEPRKTVKERTYFGLVINGILQLNQKSVYSSNALFIGKPKWWKNCNPFIERRS